MRLFGFLIQDKNLTECTEKEKAHTKTAPDFAVKNETENIKGISEIQIRIKK
jgi:hypothetical protein